jgi:hypothetical protein
VFINVDLPTFGFPIIETNPDLIDIIIYFYCGCENIERNIDTPIIRLDGNGSGIDKKTLVN